MLFDKLLLATCNRGKYEEFKSLLPESFSSRLLFAPDVAPLEVEETGETYIMNALLKASAWASASGLPALADDSGLEVEALGFKPGVLSARIVEGSDEDRTRWLLSQMLGLQNRRAHFVAALALSVPEKWSLVCEGSCSGVLSEQPSGRNGFGYDPVFIPDGHAFSFADMPAETKNKISHRAVALRILMEILYQM